MHIPHRINMHHQGHRGNHQHHHGGQGVQPQSPRNIQPPRLNPRSQHMGLGMAQNSHIIKQPRRGRGGDRHGGNRDKIRQPHTQRPPPQPRQQKAKKRRKNRNLSHGHVVCYPLSVSMAATSTV